MSAPDIAGAHLVQVRPLARTIKQRSGGASVAHQRGQSDQHDSRRKDGCGTDPDLDLPIDGPEQRSGFNPLQVGNSRNSRCRTPKQKIADASTFQPYTVIATAARMIAIFLTTGSAPW
jgi:hypothetical protein